MDVKNETVTAAMAEVGGRAMARIATALGLSTDTPPDAVADYVQSALRLRDSLDRQLREALMNHECTCVCTCPPGKYHSHHDQCIRCDLKEALLGYSR